MFAYTNNQPSSKQPTKLQIKISFESALANDVKWSVERSGVKCMWGRLFRREYSSITDIASLWLIGGWLVVQAVDLICSVISLEQ